MRILLVSDVAHTGFGRVGREIGHGLLARGHDLRVIGINYRGIDGELAPIASKHMTGGVIAATAARFELLAADPLTDRMIPATVGVNGASDPHGHRLMNPAVHGQVWQGWHADAVIFVGDPEAAKIRLLEGGPPNATCERCAPHSPPVYNYVPIEGEGLPAMWSMIWRYFQPIAMSTFGQTQLEKLLGRPVPMIPHGVSDAFYPLSPARPGRWHGNAVTSKDAAKDAIGMHGRTVVLRIDRHIFRKNYAAFFRVMRPVLAAHPELSAVIHAKPYGDEYGNLYELLSREPGAIWEKPDNILGWRHPQYLFTNAHDTWRGLEDEELNVLYNAADLLVTPTMAEGFGLTLAEALACGVPVVSTDYSAIPEVVGPGGICIPPVATITNQYAHEWALVDEPQMSAAVERLISKPALRREMGAAGRRHVARYSWSAAVDAFEALLLGAPAAVAA